MCPCRCHRAKFVAAVLVLALKGTIQLGPIQSAQIDQALDDIRHAPNDDDYHAR
jgi:hypothetical protein